MKLEQQLENIIREEAEKLIARYHEYHNRVHLETKRNAKRLGDAAPPKKSILLIIGTSIRNIIHSM